MKRMVVVTAVVVLVIKISVPHQEDRQNVRVVVSFVVDINVFFF